MNDRVLLFTIGPVKSMINNSRKMRDLYAGSYLLSYLTQKAVEELAKENDVDIILPVTQRNNGPNRILAKIHGRNEQERRTLAQELEQTVHDRFRTIWRQVFDELHIDVPAGAQSQLERFPEVYWVYDGDILGVTKKMQAVKRVRLFSQSTEPAGRKCALFPEYNVMFVRQDKEKCLPSHTGKALVVGARDHDGGIGSPSDKTTVNGSSEKSCQYALKPAEGLAALAFVKRMLYRLAEILPYYNRDISSVAYMLLKYRLQEDSAAMALLCDLKDEASETVFDLQNGQELSKDEYHSDSIKTAKELYKRLQDDHVTVSPYYALVKFDGDDMGELYRQCVSEEEQTELSQAVSEFAKYVRTVIEGSGGLCIYAGGEDFLGALPLDTLIPALLRLRRHFQKINPSVGGCGRTLTFSAGIVVAHLMQPLPEVLAAVDAMENKAKQSPGKDAFAVMVVKRGGTGLQVQNPFGEAGMNMKALWDTACDFRRKAYSASAMYQLTTVLQSVQLPKAEATRDNMVRALIRQALQSVRDEQPADLAGTPIWEEFFQLYRQWGCDVQSFVAALQIAGFWGKELASCTIK